MGVLTRSDVISERPTDCIIEDPLPWKAMNSMTFLGSAIVTLLLPLLLPFPSSGSLLPAAAEQD